MARRCGAPFNPRKSPFDPEIRPFNVYSLPTSLPGCYRSPCVRLPSSSAASQPRPVLSFRPSFSCYLEETSLTPPAAPALSLDLSISCSLFVVAKKVNSFGIKPIQPLFAKHPGWGYPVRALDEPRAFPAQQPKAETFLQLPSYIPPSRRRSCASASPTGHLSAWQGATTYALPHPTNP
jgi:hypothetical protein